MSNKAFLRYVKETAGKRNYVMPREILPSNRPDSKKLADEWMSILNTRPLRGTVLEGFVSRVNELYGSNVSVSPIGTPGTKPVVAYLMQPNNGPDLRFKCASNGAGLEEISKVADAWFAVYNSNFIAGGATGFTTIRDVLMTSNFEPVGLIEINGVRNAASTAANANSTDDIKSIFDLDRMFYFGKNGDYLRSDAEALERHITATVAGIIKYLPEERVNLHAIGDSLINRIKCSLAGPICWDSQLVNKVHLDDTIYLTDIGLDRKIVGRVYGHGLQRSKDSNVESRWHEDLKLVQNAHTGIFTIPLGIEVMSADRTMLQTLPSPTLSYVQKLMSNIFDHRRWSKFTFGQKDYWSKEFLQATFSLGQLYVAVRELKSNGGGGHWAHIVQTLMSNARVGGERNIFFDFRSSK